MKNILLLIIFLLGISQFGIAQRDSKGSFEVSVLGSDFVNRTSFGLSLGVNKNWHEYFQVGFGVQFAFHSQSNTFGYEMGSPNFSATAFTFNNTAHLYSIGNFSVDANANLGLLILNLSDRDTGYYNPAFDTFEAETLAWETFRFLQGGITLNYIVSRRTDTNVSIFARVLKNQALGNVRFGGESANSNLQFNIGVKINLF